MGIKSQTFRPTFQWSTSEKCNAILTEIANTDTIFTWMKVLKEFNIESILATCLQIKQVEQSQKRGLQTRFFVINWNWLFIDQFSFNKQSNFLRLIFSKAGHMPTPIDCMAHAKLGQFDKLNMNPIDPHGPFQKWNLQKLRSIRTSGGQLIH